MTHTLITGNGAAAWGARLARADYLPAFPITPQTEIIETLAEWIDVGEIDLRMTMMDSEHSMITAAGAAAATGVRVFSATSSQGLMYAMEMVYGVTGWRAPFVLINVSRGLETPLTLEPDHNDVMAARDSGFLQLHCATCQEVLDQTLIAYRLAEHHRVRLPVLVNLDGFYLSFTREPVEIPDQKAVDRFLPAFDPETTKFRAGEPLSQGVVVLGSTPYSYFRYESHLASLQGLKAYEEIAAEFARQFGREYHLLESYRSDDAEYVLFMMGSFATKAKDAVDRMREAGWKVGLVRPRMMRPYPEEALRKALAGKRGVAIIDQNISMGKGGVLHSELASALYGQPDMPPILASFIGGLGGRDIAPEEFFEMVKALQRAAEEGKTPPPRLMFTRNELREVRKMQAIAHTERQESSK